jgi:hypothetical protein
MIRKPALLTPALLIALAVPSVAAPPGTGWELIWSDEFDGPEIDWDTWSMGQEWPQNDCNYPMSSSVDGQPLAEIKDGILYQYARNTSSGGKQYTGCLMKTRRHGSDRAPFTFHYGYCEVRIRRDIHGPGFHMNSYTYAYDEDNYSLGGHTWPSEVDYAEILSTYDNPYKILQGPHIDRGSGHESDQSEIEGHNWREWTTYGFHWKENKLIDFYVNDEYHFTTTKQFLPDLPQYLLIRIGAGGWGGNPNSSTQWPAVQEVDWIRVWQEGEGEPTPPAIGSQPGDATVAEGNDARFSVSATGSLPMQYQWYRDDLPVDGATSGTLTIENISYDDDGATVYVIVTNQHGADTSETAALTVTDFDGVRILEVASAPAIDGAVEGLWNAADTYSPGQTLVGSVSGADDLSCEARFMWDADNLYCLFDVVDDVKETGFSGDQNYHNDGIELYIDADNSKSGSYDDNDFLYRFMWDVADPYESKHSATQQVRLGQEDTDNGYRIEAAIPWQTLGVSVQQGDLIGIDVHINDNDGSERTGKLALYAGEDDAWQDPSLFGDAKLYEASSTGTLTRRPSAGASPIGIRAHGRRVVLSAVKDARVTMFTVGGRMVYDAVVSEGNHTMAMPSNGCYIVYVRRKGRLVKTTPLTLYAD